MNEAAAMFGSFKAAFESLIIISEAIERAQAINILSGRESAPELDQLNDARKEIQAMVQATFVGKEPTFPHLEKKLREVASRKVKPG